MHTIKSACLVVVLLGVLYAVYTALNKPDLALPGGPGSEDTSPLIEYGTAGGNFSSPTTSPGSPSSNLPSDPATDRTSQSGASHYEAGSLPSSAPSGLQRSAYEAPIASPAAESGFGTASTAVATEPTNPPATTIAPVSAPSPALAAYDLKRDLAEVDQLVASGKFRAALAKLTPHYADEGLAEEQRRTLVSWLDALAGKVIYSREHLVAPAHQVRKGEDLYQIAQQYNVEYRLLQSINQQEVSDPLVLVPSIELKVIPGPFKAQVSLAASEITLFVGELYAGRFSFTLGDQPPQPGTYKVVDKRAQQKTFVGFDGRVIPANDPANPYGGWWISLGGEVAIHGSPLTPAATTLGCISLSPQDAKDVYGILSLGSEVTIQP